MRVSEKNVIPYSILDSRTLGNGAGTKAVIIQGSQGIRGPSEFFTRRMYLHS